MQYRGGLDSIPEDANAVYADSLLMFQAGRTPLLRFFDSILTHRGI